ncbi:galactose-3-O-sulfotransferase 4 [Anolis carolinensis]|uniref:galactose-3-O-sulfotransferase 4 n=1 Tax=Anolis carolinensis TaxID=28377 RepID=UPI002F2B35E6
MKALLGVCCCCCRHPQVLWAALAASMTIGFALQLLGVSFQKREPLLQPLPPSPSPTCRPRQHVVFLKTHKTGSSTVVNILHRFGDLRGLRFALPARYQFSYPSLFQARRVKGWHPRGRPFDLLCHHMRFNLPEVRKVVPGDSFYFSVVRDPVSLAESAFSYFRGVASAFRRAPSLPAFLAAPQRFFRPGERGNHYARNLLWFDFGLDPPSAPGPGPVREALAGLDRTFDLVLLTEHMDESLVLLAEALCWALEDVVAFRHNLRSPRARAPALSPLDAARLRAWNHLDWQLYVHFNASFWERAERFGRGRLAEAVGRLRALRAEREGRCLRGGGPLEPTHIPDQAVRPFQFGQAPILGYALRPGLRPPWSQRCRRLVTPELQYKDLLDAKQFPPKGNATRPAPA